MGYITWRLFTSTKSSGYIYFEPDTGLPYKIKTIYKKVYIPVKGKKFVEEKLVEDKSIKDEEKTIEECYVSILPERFRQFARMDGNYLWPYFKNVDGMYGSLQAPIYHILQYFPTWESIKESDKWTQNGWDETKHNLFKECLEWCNTQEMVFWGEWPY